jgi:hypothetical protein
VKNRRPARRPGRLTPLAETRPAGEHLRHVWRVERPRINTAGDFVRQAGHPETTDGPAPRLRFPDGLEVPAESWLAGELDKSK